MSRRRTAAGEIYERIVGDEDARVCRDIPDEACREVPGNFLLQVLARVSTKLGDRLASPKVVLPWLLGTVGAPAALVGFLVPVREAGSLLPQLVIAALLRRAPIRKTWWVVGSLVQGASVAGMGAAAVLLEGASAGWAVLGLLVLFSLARGVCSVTSKDLVGKTVPKTRRGRLSGLSASISGGLTLVAGAGLGAVAVDRLEPGFFLALLGGAGGLWIVAALLFSRLRETPGATEGGGNAAAEAVRSLRLLVTDTGLRRLVVARGLLVSTALVAPYYVMLARDRGESAAALGGLIAASGFASLVSGYFWGSLADRSSRLTLVAAAGLVVFLAVVQYLLGRWFDPPAWIYPVYVLVLGIGHSGVRLGRKTHLVDLADSGTRSAYVAVSNTVIGVVLLIGGLLGTLAGVLQPEGMILVMAGFTLAGGVTAWTLEEVQT